MSKRDDALQHVKESLRSNNCALVHKDDIFTDEEQRMWDSAQEFVDRFVNSDEAKSFEKVFHDHIQANIAFDRAARQMLELLSEQVEVTGAVLDLAKRECATAEESASKKYRKKKKAYMQAKSEAKLARADLKETQKRLVIERKSMNTVFKPYIFTEVHWRKRRLTWNDPSVLLGTAPTLLAIARDYYEEPAKVRIPTLWRVSAVPKGIELPARVGSQLWHRDQGDDRMLKLFAYFSDVDEGSGALEYVPSSLPKNSKWAEKIPLTAQSGYPPQELVNDQVPKDEIFRCLGRAGTLAFADTAGLHRGGYAVTGPRVTVQATYLREKTIIPQTPMIPRGAVVSGLTPEQQWALS